MRHPGLAPIGVRDGNEDAFVAKVNAGGTALVYAGYIGGSADEGGFGIAVDSSANAYVVGETTSTAATFPETVGPDLTFNGSTDAFVAKVNAGGTALVYAGYIGGSGVEEGWFGIAVDGVGAAYVAGRTTSTQATFPETVGPDLTFNGGTDAFVAKVNGSGTALIYAGYIGGSADDFGNDIALDGSQHAYVTGETSSTAATFPETGGPDLTFNGGVSDAFVAKLNTTGSTLVYAGYIGGVAADGGLGIAADSTGSAYVTGSTNSAAGFPVSGGPDLTFNGPGGDAFVARVGPAGCTIVGTQGNDVLVGTAGPDVICGLGGNDILTGDAGIDNIQGGDGNDTINGGDDTDFITGGNGNDNLTGGNGSDFIVGVAGRDTLTGQSGDDILDGGTGIDTASFSGGAAVVANLTTGTATGQGTDSLAAIENLTGSSFADTLTGSSGANTITALAGNDALFGVDGNDTINGGTGDDNIDGGLGTDTATFAGGTAVTANLTTGTATGQGTDTLVAVENLTGSSSGDSLTGSSIANQISGAGGPDMILGLDGNDSLSGGFGNDLLDGGNGDDNLNGGDGTDTCIQGTGTGTLTSCEL